MSNYSNGSFGLDPPPSPTITTYHGHDTPAVVTNQHHVPAYITTHNYNTQAPREPPPFYSLSQFLGTQNQPVFGAENSVWHPTCFK